VGQPHVRRDDDAFNQLFERKWAHHQQREFDPVIRREAVAHAERGDEFPDGAPATVLQRTAGRVGDEGELP